MDGTFGGHFGGLGSTKKLIYLTSSVVSGVPILYRWDETEIVSGKFFGREKRRDHLEVIHVNAPTCGLA